MFGATWWTFVGVVQWAGSRRAASATIGATALPARRDPSGALPITIAAGPAADLVREAVRSDGGEARRRARSRRDAERLVEDDRARVAIRFVTPREHAPSRREPSPACRTSASRPPTTHPDRPRPGRCAVAAGCRTTRRRTPLIATLSPVDAVAVGTDDRHRRRARHTRDRDRQRPHPPRVDDRGPRRERRAMQAARRCGCAATCLGGSRPELDQDGDRDDDAAEQQTPRRVAERRSRANTPKSRVRFSQPSPSSGSEEHRLDDQDPAVRRRPDLGDGVKLGHCPGEPGCSKHITAQRTPSSRNAARRRCRSESSARSRAGRT